jgi:hypothetical protein
VFYVIWSWWPGRPGSEAAPGFTYFFLPPLEPRLFGRSLMVVSGCRRTVACVTNLPVFALRPRTVNAPS